MAVNVTVSLNQEVRSTANGNKKATEFRPFIHAKGRGAQYIRIDLTRDIDLTKDYFAVITDQGGNRVGTYKDKNFKQFDTGYLDYVLSPMANGNKFVRTWAGPGYGNGKCCEWVVGRTGNEMMFHGPKEGKMPQGSYLLKFTPKWYATRKEDKVVNDAAFIFASPVEMRLSNLSI